MRDWRLRAVSLAAGVSGGLVAVLALLGTVEPTAYVAAVAGACLAAPFRFRVPRRWLAALDWRKGAIFASWVGAVVFFFVVVGAAVAAASLARPEDEAFDARARILFRRETGAHIDYIVSRLRSVFEHYAESTRNRIVLLDYDETEAKFRVAIEGRTVVRSSLDDITSTYGSAIAFSEITPPPSSQADNRHADNRLVYLRIDSVSQDVVGAHSGSDIDFPFTTTIPPGGRSTIEHRVEVRVASASEPIWHTPIRYTQRIALDVESHLSAGRRARVGLSIGEGAPPQEVRIVPGDDKTLCITSDLPPNAISYTLRLTALDPPEATHM